MVEAVTGKGRVGRARTPHQDPAPQKPWRKKLSPTMELLQGTDTGRLEPLSKAR